MLFDIGLINGKGVCVVLINGRIIKVIVDNIDGRIKVNQVLYMILIYFYFIIVLQYILVDQERKLIVIDQIFFN